MADSLKILGQSSPSAGILTSLYTVAAGVSAVVSSVVVCNIGASQTTFRISFAVNGETDSVKQYVAYDSPLQGNTSQVVSMGTALGAGDVVRVSSGNGFLSFSLFGIEVS